MKTMCHPMESQPSTYRRRPCGSPAKYRPSRRWASCSSFQAAQDAAVFIPPPPPHQVSDPLGGQDSKTPCHVAAGWRSGLWKSIPEATSVEVKSSRVVGVSGRL